MTKISSGALAVAPGVFFDDDFSGEGAINEGEVAGGQDHADDPPDQTAPQAVVGGFCAVDGERINRVASGKNHGEQAEDYAGQHAGYIQAGGQERFWFVALDQ